MSVRLARRLGATVVPLALAASCTPPPTTPTWQRSDVSAESTREVELDCHQRAIEAIPAGTNAAERQRVHEAREQYFARCMRGSGFTPRP